MPRNVAISRASSGCALPENTFSSPNPVAMRGSPTITCSSPHIVAGAEGFEPSNTGSKVPRLTAWPRPNVGTRPPVSLAHAMLTEGLMTEGTINYLRALTKRQVYPMGLLGGKSLVRTTIQRPRHD